MCMLSPIKTGRLQVVLKIYTVTRYDQNLKKSTSKHLIGWKDPLTEIKEFNKRVRKRFRA